MLLPAIAAANPRDQPSRLHAREDEILKAGGLLVIFLFWIHQEHTMTYWNHFVSRVAKLEEE